MRELHVKDITEFCKRITWSQLTILGKAFERLDSVTDKKEESKDEDNKPEKEYSEMTGEEYLMDQNRQGGLF